MTDYKNVWKQTHHIAGIFIEKVSHDKVNKCFEKTRQIAGIFNKTLSHEKSKRF